MATVSFAAAEDIWIAPRWIFFGFLEAALARAEDSNLRDVLTEAIAFENLDFASLDPTVVARVASHLLDVANLVAEEEVKAELNGQPLDAESQAQFRAKIRALAALVAGVSRPE